MPGFLATLRSLFLGRDDAPAAVRRGGPDRIDAAGTMPVPADSQEIVTMARDFRAFLDMQDQRQQELARVVSALPQSMGALPELVRQQTRLADLVAQLGLDSRKVAVERNLEIVPRSLFEATSIEDGDRIEIVTIIGGG